MVNYAFLQARMGSSRLPGKTLMTMAGKPMIAIVIERLQRIVDCHVVVLTTDQKSDDVLCEWCEDHGIKYFRGSEDNVLQRYTLAAEHFDADQVIRATGDNPLVEPYFASRLLEQHIALRMDYSSNKSEVGSKLPDGFGVEIFSRQALDRVNKLSSQAHHYEHVNEYLLENEKQFNLFKDTEAGGPQDRSAIRLTVDTDEDFTHMTDIVENEQFHIDIGYEDLLKLL